MSELRLVTTAAHLSDAGEEMVATLSPELREIAYRIRSSAVETQEAAQSAIHRALETGELLMQLKEALGLTNGGNRGNQFARAPRGTLVNFTFEDLASELGVARRTAFRWMALAKAERLARRLEAGEIVELPGAKAGDGPRVLGGTMDHIETARQWRESLYAGETPITRAQPALMGALATKKTGRAPCDHGRNLARAIKALANSLEAWDRLKPEERARCERLWAQLATSGLIPHTWEGHRR